MCCSADHDMLHQQMTYGMMYPCCKENNNLANDPIIDSKNELIWLKKEIKLPEFAHFLRLDEEITNSLRSKIVPLPDRK